MASVRLKIDFLSNYYYYFFSFEIILSEKVQLCNFTSDLDVISTLLFLVFQKAQKIAFTCYIFILKSSFFTWFLQIMLNCNIWFPFPS